MVELCKEWTAFHDTMPGKPPTLRVDGTCCFRTDGWTAELVEHDGPQGINPKILIIDLVVTAPSSGAAEVLTEIPVHFERRTDFEYDQVSVHVRDGEGEGRTIDVVPVS